MLGDRRTAPRALHKLRVVIAGEVALTADVTANGFSVETAHPAQPGISVSGTITVGQREFAFTGMVCWTRADDPQHGRMGVRFLEVPQDFKVEFETMH